MPTEISTMEEYILATKIMKHEFDDFNKNADNPKEDLITFAIKIATFYP